MKYLDCDLTKEGIFVFKLFSPLGEDCQLCDIKQTLVCNLNSDNQNGPSEGSFTLQRLSWSWLTTTICLVRILVVVIDGQVGLLNHNLSMVLVLGLREIKVIINPI